MAAVSSLVSGGCSLHGCVVLPEVNIGRHAKLSRVIGEDPELDAQRFRRSEHGVCLVTQPMIDRLAD